MAAMPTGTVTFLFTDIEGSTRLLQQLKDAYAVVLVECRQLVRTAVQERGGQEVDTEGDALFAAFPSAREALMAAVMAQQSILRHPWPDRAAVRVRMGLHTGEARIAEGGYVGMDVHRAARICGAAHGGQIVVSDVTHGLVSRDLPHGVSLRDLGEHRLKDLAHPHRLFQALALDLPTDFPPLRSLDAHLHNLPIQLTNFIGREQEKVEVRRLLSTTRFLTLTGSGGAGKTRLALQVAAEALDEFPDGVWLAELAALSDPSLVPIAVASALGVPEQPGRMLIETLADFLRGKSVLVILDNCEHLVAACAHVVSDLLRSCPNLSILATSREALGVTGETTRRVPSMSAPDPQRLPPLDHLTEYEAVRLFIDRAVASAPQFSLTSNNAPAVAHVCHRLGGIPLALELAAARVKVLAVEQIASRLDDRFRLLTGGSRTALPRQQTLRGAMDWSYDLLSQKERTVLRRLSVFAGGWTLEAAEAICSEDGIETSAILDLLIQLVDKSLVVVEAHGCEARYSLLETVRQYGRDRLVESEKLETMRDRHLSFFLDLAERAEPQLDGAERTVWLNRLGTEHANLREALAWSMQGVPEKGLRLAGALGRFWDMRGHFAEGRGWLKEALERSAGGSVALRAKALSWAGWMSVRQVDYAAARLFHEQSLAIYRELEDKRGLADSFFALGSLSMNEADHESACAFFEKSLAIYRQLGNKRGIVSTLKGLGHETWHQGDYATARRFLAESMAHARECGEQRPDIFALWSLGLVAFDQRNYVEAHSLYEEGLATAKDLGDVWIGTFLVEAFAALIAAEGQYVRAARLLGAAEAHRRINGSPLPFSHRSDYNRPVAIIRAGLNEDAFAAAWAEGGRMTLEQAIKYALTAEWQREPH